MFFQKLNGDLVGKIALNIAQRQFRPERQVVQFSLGFKKLNFSDDFLPDQNLTGVAVPVTAYPANLSQAFLRKFEFTGKYLE
jgi:hypothetical protein